MKTLITMTILLLIQSYAIAIDTCNSGWSLGATQKTIDCHSVCHKAQSTTPIFAPTKTSTEWSNFRAAVPTRLNYVTLSDCCVANQGDVCGAEACKNAGTIACDGTCTGVTNMADETSCGTCSKCSAGTCVMYGSETFLYPKVDGTLVHGNSANANCFCKNRGYDQACGYDLVAGTDNNCVHFNATTCEPDDPISHSGDVVYSIICEGFIPGCTTVTENLGGTCTDLDDANGKGFKLTGTALKYNGYTFDDDNLTAGGNNPKNYCLLALYGNMGSYSLVPNANSYVVKDSSGTSQAHFFGRCTTGECTTCTNDHIMTSGEDFNNFSTGDACAGNADTDKPTSELWCYWDIGQPSCTPDCSCASSIPSTSTCSDGCSGTCTGTCNANMGNSCTPTNQCKVGSVACDGSCTQTTTNASSGTSCDSGAGFCDGSGTCTAGTLSTVCEPGGTSCHGAMGFSMHIDAGSTWGGSPSPISDAAVNADAVCVSKGYASALDYETATAPTSCGCGFGICRYNGSSWTCNNVNCFCGSTITYLSKIRCITPPSADLLGAGSYHTCVVDSNGAVKCWGQGSQGKLGDGGTSNRYTAVDVSGLSSGVRSISSGSNFNCIITDAGAVKCWGDNGNGQLGDGTTTDRYTPVSVSGLSSGVIAITTGIDHTCALTSTGAVKCWGKNEFGQLGDGSTTDRHTPVNVSGLSSGVISIGGGSRGGNHTCAVTSSGAAKCWGFNTEGQVGDGSTTHRSTPVAVSGSSSGMATVDTGVRTTCSTSTTGALKCWGKGQYGAIGDGTTTNRLTPVNVTGLSSGVVDVKMGGSHACALTNAGAVKCWGNGDYGGIGDGTTSDRLTPVSVSGLSSGVVAIAVGGLHSCALTDTGTVKCWGYNGNGELGDGTTANRNTPVNSTTWYHGTWSGNVTQPGYGTYATNVVVNQNGTGTIDFPSLSCGGTVTKVSETSTTFVFVEDITYGNCTDNSNSSLTKSGSQVIYTWGTSTTNGTLTKQ